MATRVRETDVLVVGSGGAGLTAAVTASHAGLDVVLAEKDAVLGGTTATSGGTLWIPGNRHSRRLGPASGIEDSRERAKRYLEIESGQYIDPAKIDAYLDDGPRMVDFLEDETEAAFDVRPFPDYHSVQEGASQLRSIAPVEYDAARVGALMPLIKPVLPQTSFLGLTMRSSAEVTMFCSVFQSWKAFRYVAGRMTGHLFEMLRYGQSRRLAGGRALVARLVVSAARSGVDLMVSSPVRALLSEGGRVVGARLETPEGPLEIRARRGVVLAAGGITRDPDRRRAEYPAAIARTPVLAPTAPGNTGDMARLAEGLGARFNGNVANVAAWMPVSNLPGRSDYTAVWPHLVDRYKPGFLIVLPDGKRFANESASYHDLGSEMVRAFALRGADHAWLIGDAAAVRRWGIGFARPFPIPKGALLRSGYLLKAPTLAALATRAGIDAKALTRTVEAFNEGAREGRDPEFGRGSAPYDRFHGDADHRPNPALGPVERAPFYAVRLYPGEIGSFGGLATDAWARVLDTSDRPIPGLYAVGNEQANAFGGAYPGAGGTLGPGLTFAWRAARLIAGNSDSNESEIEPAPAAPDQVSSRATG